MLNTAFLLKYDDKIEQISMDTLDHQELGVLPEFWVEALSKSSPSEKVEVILNHWNKFLYQFQSTVSYLRRNLIDVELIWEGNDLFFEKPKRRGSLLHRL